MFNWCLFLGFLLTLVALLVQNLQPVQAATITLGCDPLNSTCPEFSSCVPACHTSNIDHICRCNEKNFFFKDLQSRDFQCYTSLLKLFQLFLKIVFLFQFYFSGESGSSLQRYASVPWLGIRVSQWKVSLTLKIRLFF